MTAFYNEIDPYAAEWLRRLVAAGHIANGVVDERSITEIDPEELKQYTQCHFFAGIGVWSHALRSAGWPDSRPVWTGSCPCQPFSAAGKGKGFADERHLWPAWFRLIRECRPVAVIGEQVASKDALAWLDNVSTDMEAEGYTFGSVDSCAAGYGAPHIRQRLYFVAHAGSGATGQYAGELQSDEGEHEVGTTHSDHRAQRSGAVGELADNDSIGRRGRRSGEAVSEQGQVERSERCGDAGDMGNALNAGLEGHTGDGYDRNEPGRQRADQAGSVAEAGADGKLEYASSVRREVALFDAGGSTAQAGERQADECGSGGATNGFWSDAIWLPCRDGKARPTKPGIFPLAHGATQRVGRLRAYGNAITAPQAAEFVKAFMTIADASLIGAKEKRE